MAQAWITMTIKVETPDTDEYEARHSAETISSALSALLKGGNAARVWSSIISTFPDNETELNEAAAVRELSAKLQVLSS